MFDTRILCGFLATVSKGFTGMMLFSAFQSHMSLWHVLHDSTPAYLL
jgi:hypothetical protein